MLPSSLQHDAMRHTRDTTDYFTVYFSCRSEASVRSRRLIDTDADIVTVNIPNLGQVKSRAHRAPGGLRTQPAQ